MLGRVCRPSPQFISISDGSWLGTSAYIERMTQRSSACVVAVRAKSSLTSMPLCPYLRNVNGEPIAAPVLRSVRRLGPGSGLPWYFVEQGLGIERVDVRRAAVHEQVDDLLGPGRKLG